MKKVVRAKHVTLLSVKVVDILEEKVKDISLTLPHWYTSNKIMVTKLQEILSEQKLRLIEVYSAEKYVRYFEQSLSYFEEKAENVYDVLHKTTKNEKE